MTKESTQQESAKSKLKNHRSDEDELNVGLTILSFCIPIIGGIIWLSNKSNSPKKAKSACHAALWGIGIAFLIQIFATIGGA